MRKGLLALVTAVVLSTLSIPAQALQCVPYARQISGIDLQGDAWKWWSAAAGRYDRGRTPQVDAVMVFSRQGSMRYGHVSVVSKVVNSRMILVDHANWAPVRSAGRGAITKLVPVLDVSDRNDWSKVRVWYEPSSSFGSKVYRADGFVYNPSRRANPAKGGVQKIALKRENLAITAMGKDIALETALFEDSEVEVDETTESAPVAKAQPEKLESAKVTAPPVEPIAAKAEPVAVAAVKPTQAEPAQAKAEAVAVAEVKPTQGEPAPAKAEPVAVGAGKADPGRARDRCRQAAGRCRRRSGSPDFGLRSRPTTTGAAPSRLPRLRSGPRGPASGFRGQLGPWTPRPGTALPNPRTF
uniref:Surface antigen n=1 Tax=Magnetospirillum gryphiswaldense TaxID=55518 RepID=A4U4B7_9PROT|nr:Surface antigen [Magnetospirillum gryphiswaldense MSR-1]